ncbi:MAG: hypothetical protein KC478_04795 [Bacteriovoracaceae bacterium]|nr:hypothetical protein [Bacteriovoracaceae bacterium]
MSKKNLSNLSWRESWDAIDSAFLKMDLKLEDLLGLMGISEKEYFERRNSDSPPPEGALEKLRNLMDGNLST